MAAARLRRPPGHPARPAFDDQAIDGLAALEGYTTAAALTAGDQDRLGRVRACFCADLTVLGEDPVDCDPDELPANPVLLTVVDGEVVFRGSGLDR
jgi:predicted amidohydrolase YtcJ